MAARRNAAGGLTFAAPTGISPPPEAPEQGLRGDVLRGLLSTPKTLPPTVFYDEEGAALFERITQLEQYYLTRAEIEILATHASDIESLAGIDSALIEYGTGAGIKTRILIDALRPRSYVPVDISSVQLLRVAGEIASAYPRLQVSPANVDYTAPLSLSAPLPGARRIGFFPGSAIGNLHPSEAATFLREVRRTVGPGGALILGVDRRKEARTLEAAYNDTEGVTAAFNLNILHRLNRELEADFDLSMFEHRAFFNGDASRIEMHLVSKEAQMIHVAGTPIHLERGETIRTEYSYKYDEPGIERLASAGGFALRQKWTDSQEQFWVAFLEVRPDRFGAMR